MGQPRQCRRPTSSNRRPNPGHPALDSAPGRRTKMNSSPTYSIAISGTFDVANYGDLMFPIMAEYELCRRLGNVQLTRYSYLEKVAHSWPYDVTPLSRLGNELASHSGLLIGGGHLIRFDKQIADGYHPSDAEIHHPTGYWLTPALAAANVGIPVYWNGPSASMDTPAWAAPLLKAALSLSEYVSVRDEATASEMRNVGYMGPCSIIPDTVFGLPGLLSLDQARTRAAPLLDQAGITGPYIVVQAKSELAGIAQMLADHPDTQNLQILILAIGPVLGEHASQITDTVPTAKFLDFWPSPLDTAALIAASEGTVAISLHLTITSLCYGLPVLRHTLHRLTKYQFIEASKNVFLHSGGDEPLPESYVSRLAQREPCSIAQQAKSVLDAHWEHIAGSLSGKRRRAEEDFFRIWNSAVAQSEELAERALRTESTLRAETVAIQQSLAETQQSLAEVQQAHAAAQQALAAQTEHRLDALRTLHATSAELEQTKQRERSTLIDMQQLVAEHNAQIQDILSSRSWRLTKPLRMFTAMARNIKNRVFPGRPRG